MSQTRNERGEKKQEANNPSGGLSKSFVIVVFEQPNRIFNKLSELFEQRFLFVVMDLSIDFLKKTKKIVPQDKLRMARVSNCEFVCLCGIFGRLFKEHVLRVRMFNVAAMSVLRFNDLHLSSVVIPKWIYPINKPKRIIQLISVDNVLFIHCQWFLSLSMDIGHFRLTFDWVFVSCRFCS